MQDHLDLMRYLAGEWPNETVTKNLLQHLEKSIREEGQARQDYEARACYARPFLPIANLYDHIRAQEVHHHAELTDMFNKLRATAQTVVHYRGYVIYLHEYSPWDKKWNIKRGRELVGTAPTLEEAKKRVDRLKSGGRR